MKWHIQRFFLIFLTSWMLIGNSGISWTQETCLFTGNTKNSFDVSNHSNPFSKPHFSRSSCYQYDHFQLKFGIDQVVQKKSQVTDQVVAFHAFVGLTKPLFVGYRPSFSSQLVPQGILPSGHIRRLAYLGVFQI
ncbi:MAG: hypothetical protein RI903_1173 [Bacteroidota bacterium]